MLFRDVLRSHSLMEHSVRVTDVADRRGWLAGLCGGKSVLHVGCCDVPVFDPETNLHIFLAKHTDRLDGLDISVEGIEVLRRHVDGDYFTTPAEVTKEYDVVLVPEVLEHTPNAREFLSGMFSIGAQTYLFTAPHIQWFERTRREGDVFHEEVHGDHRAWYSPYTLLNALAPFIDAERDDVEVYLLSATGSVAARVTTPRTPKPFPARIREHAAPLVTAASAGVDVVLESAQDLASSGDVAMALKLLEAARGESEDARLVHLQMKLLLGLGRNMDALRIGVARMRAVPNEAKCLRLCADALEALGDPAQARELRALADAQDAD